MTKLFRWRSASWIVLLSVLPLATAGSEELPTCDAVSHLPFFKNRVEGLELEETNLDAVTARFGNAPRSTVKLAECCLQEVICYVSPDGRRALKFVSWEKSVITAYEITSDRRQISTLKDCAKLDPFPANLKSSTGIKTGMTKKEVLARLGTPTTANTEKNEFEYQRKCRDLKLGSGWQTAVYIWVRFLEDKVISFRVEQSTQG